ncbi:MAG: DNA methyltransferase [Candidatus Hodarchaeota archaeon]
MKIFIDIGYTIKGRIVWKKPDGYVRISQRSGVFLQNPYPMYYYPDNLIECILIFQKPKKIILEKPNTIYESNVWEMTNVLPIEGRLEEKIAAFPLILPKKIIKLFTREQQSVCDPFVGSGTTMRVARDLKRNSIGIEILKELVPIIRKKTGFISESLEHFLLNDDFKIIEIKDHKGSQFSYKPLSYIQNVLKSNFNINHKAKFHLVILNVFKPEDIMYFEENVNYIEHIHPGRIILIFYSPELDKYNFYSKIFNFMLKRGIKFRDKITIWHKSSYNRSWTIQTNNNEEIIFDHSYYEILIFQKGKYNYKSVEKERKANSILDKNRFQKKKWFLSIWDFRKLTVSESIRKCYSRLIPLFHYEGEVIASNQNNIICRERKFSLLII